MNASRSLAIVCLILLAGSCAYQPQEYPVTQRSQKFTEYDASQAKLAPPV
jgi:hypothetical protein